MKDVLKDISKTFSLWRIWLRLGVHDIRLRFSRSAIGVAWIFVNLTITVLSIGLVYGVLLKQDIHEFIPMLTISLIIWGYLVASIVDGSNAFVASEGYIKQIALPIYVYILRWFVSISLTTLISLLAYIVVVIVFGVRIGWGVLWVVPGMALLGIVSLLAITIFAHLNTCFRDTSHLAASIMQVMFYVTPIIWPPEMLRSHGFGSILDFNPFYHLLEVVRQPLLYSRPATPTNYLVSGGVILLMAGLSAYLMRYYRHRLVFLL